MGGDDLEWNSDGKVQDLGGSCCLIESIASRNTTCLALNQSHATDSDVASPSMHIRHSQRLLQVALASYDHRCAREKSHVFLSISRSSTSAAAAVYQTRYHHSAGLQLRVQCQRRSHRWPLQIFSIFASAWAALAPADRLAALPLSHLNLNGNLHCLYCYGTAASSCWRELCPIQRCAGCRHVTSSGMLDILPHCGRLQVLHAAATPAMCPAVGSALGSHCKVKPVALCCFQHSKRVCCRLLQTWM